MTAKWDDMAVVGRIARTHGLRGEMVVNVETDFPEERFQPGAELLAAWYKRNFYICAHLLQTAFPGDRVAVFYGYGHLFLLRQCVAETPGFRLIEATAYLPR